MPWWTDTEGTRRARGPRRPGVTARVGPTLMISLLAFALGAFAGGLECQSRAVDAIARPGRLRAVGEDVAKMRLAFGAAHLGAAHEQGSVLVLAHRFPLRGRIEARPAGAGLVFRVGAEQRFAAADAAIHALPLLRVIRMAEGPLCAMLARHVVLLRRKLLPPLRLGFRHLIFRLRFDLLALAHGGERPWLRLHWYVRNIGAPGGLPKRSHHRSRRLDSRNKCRGSIA